MSNRVHITIVALLAIALMLAIAFKTHTKTAQHETREPESTLRAGMSDKAKRLIAAYPDHLDGIEGNSIVWKDGTHMPFDDGVENKDFEALLNSPDIEDQFAYIYEPGAMAGDPPLNVDPGRIRYEPFFNKMYGDCKNGKLGAKLAAVQWMPSRGGSPMNVTTVNGVDKKLKAVIDDLEKLPGQFTKYLVPSAGVFNCRVIAGTKRRSVHAYGAAIDINVKQSDYWRNEKLDASGRYRYRNKIPNEIVEIFERHGFIWGGKWYHFDTMHFEYRPELVGNAN